MPDFGNVDGTPDIAIRIEDRCRGSVFTCPEGGYGESITAHVRNPMTYPVPTACAIYNSSAQLLGITEEISVPGAHNAWMTFALTSPVPLTAGESYLLVSWSDTGGDVDNMCTFTPGIYPKADFERYDYPNFPNPHRYMDYTDYEVTFLIYCTYNTAAPDCTNPDGWQGDTICGDSLYGQDPTHLYECQCVGGVCNWVDLGPDPSCEPPVNCTNPNGIHGQIDACGDGGANQPDTTHTYQCYDGAWYDQGENCPYCPDCEVTEGCINPAGNEGDIICGNPAYGQDPTHQYDCGSDGYWHDRGYSPACVGNGEIPWIPIAIGVAVAAVVIVGIALIKIKK